MKKSASIFLIFFLFLFSLFIFRHTILRGIGNYLIVEQPLKHTDAMFVLGGGAYDRGNEAVKIFQQGWVKKIYCTSKNIPHDFKVFNMNYPESEITKIRIRNAGVPDSLITAIHEATSTKEEAVVILAFCKKNNLHSCILLSDKFHTLRIKKVFSEKFKNNGIEIIIRGSPSSRYDENKWWEKEEGMIMVNNEYMKHLYYWWKYSKIGNKKDER